MSNTHHVLSMYVPPGTTTHQCTYAPAKILHKSLLHTCTHTYVCSICTDVLTAIGSTATMNEENNNACRSSKYGVRKAPMTPNIHKITPINATTKFKCKQKIVPTSAFQLIVNKPPEVAWLCSLSSCSSLNARSCLPIKRKFATVPTYTLVNCTR
jgi:hypothetical protein